MHNVLKGLSLNYRVHTTVPKWTWIDWVSIWPVVDFFTTMNFVGEICPVDSGFVLPRNLCWHSRVRQPVWNEPFGTNIADCITGGMSSSLLNLGIFFIVLLVEFVCVVKLAGSSGGGGDCVLPTVAHGGGSVHVWGAIHYDGRTNIVILERNITAGTYRQLLETEVLPYARRHFGRNFLFQHDNTPAHQARRMKDFLQDEEVEQLPWPPYSPVLNHIEHVWNGLDHAIRQRERSSQPIWVNCLILSPRNGMHSAKDTWTSWLSLSPDASLLSSRHEEDIPVTKCISPDWTFWGYIFSGGGFAVTSSSLVLACTSSAKLSLFYTILKWAPMTSSSVHFVLQIWYELW